jgi:hypothetical protein
MNMAPTKQKYGCSASHHAAYSSGELMYLVWILTRGAGVIHVHHVPMGPAVGTGWVSGVVMADMMVVVMVMAAVWLGARDKEEREAFGMAWARLILLAARAAWVVMRWAVFMAWMSLVAAWATLWYPTVPVVS